MVILFVISLWLYYNYIMKIRLLSFIYFIGRLIKFTILLPIIVLVSPVLIIVCIIVGAYYYLFNKPLPQSRKSRDKELLLNRINRELDYLIDNSNFESNTDFPNKILRIKQYVGNL